MTASDTQIGGYHYVTKTVQPWDAMESWMSPEQFSGFLRGNAIKYLARYTDKGGVQDLEKARHYLDKLIEHEANCDSKRSVPETDPRLFPEVCRDAT